MQRPILALAAGSLAMITFGLAACSAGTQADDSAAGSEQGLASSVHVLTSRYDSARTGANLAEKVLTTSNVSGQTFGKVFTRNVDGQVYAQPLYVSGALGGVNGKNLVYVATEHNSIYAFDADDMRTTAPPVWQKSFGPSVPSADTGCGLLTPEIGITSTPVIDIVAKTMWFTAKTKASSAYIHRLHAVDIATGTERPNSPVVITASAPGSGAGSVAGVLTMDPLRHMNRPGLLKAGNAIYLGSRRTATSARITAGCSATTPPRSRRPRSTSTRRTAARAAYGTAASGSTPTRTATSSTSAAMARSTA